MTLNPPAIGYTIPTQHYVLADHELRAKAKQVAIQTAQMVHDKNIDPGNLVIAVGEVHGILPINLFQYYLMGELKAQFSQLMVCDERQNQDADTRLKPPKGLTHETLPDRLHDYPRNPFYVMPAYATHCHDIAYYPIDLNTDTTTGDYHTQGLDDTFLKPYAHIPFVKGVYESIAHDLPFCTDGETINARGEQGKTIRDLFMMDQIMRTQAQTNAPILTLNGALHLTDYKYPNRFTLQELLLVNGKDMVIVQLSPDRNDLEQRQTQQEVITDRMTPQMRKHLHAITYFKTDWRGWYGADVMRTVMAAQIVP